MQKYSREQKIAACEDYLSGKKKVSEICRDLGLSNCNAPGCFWNWVHRYEKYGRDAFSEKKEHKYYTVEFKKEVVKAYMEGEGSFMEIALKYGVTTDDMVRKWYKRYKDEKAGTVQ